MTDGRRARDIDLLDAIDAFPRETVDAEVWRLARLGRDPTIGSPSRSRWCDGNFDVLYTSFEKEGAMAEIHSLLSLQPVFPSKDAWCASRLKIKAAATLKLADLPTLEKLGVPTARYAERDYTETQHVADAAYFLGFDGLIAPSARWSCLNLMLFTDRIPPGQIQVAETSQQPIRWDEWRARNKRPLTP